MLKTKTLFIGITIMASIGIAALGLVRHTTMAEAGANTVKPWWPVEGSRVTGVQPFKAAVSNSAVEDYDMFWQVDDGARNIMPSNYTDHPHKETRVNLNGWTWRGSGPYKVTYTAVSKQDGRQLATRSINIYVGSGPSTPPKTEDPGKDPGGSEPITPIPPSDPDPVQPPVAVGDLSGLSLYSRPHELALRQASQLASQGRTKDAEIMKRLANTPRAEWFGGWMSDVRAAARNYVSSAPANSLPVLVAYNIPYRDCGSYSAGGTEESKYVGWIRNLANGIGSYPAMVVLEPDALAQISCLNDSAAAKRMDLMRQAVAALKANANTRVYIDIGHANWVSVDKAADRLKQADIAKVDGFSLNVSNFTTTEANISYGSKISAKVGGSHFVIDTSRNGNGPAPGNEWCNPSGRALGQASTTRTGNSIVDAFIWIKTPGESDGTCNGGPSAGGWMPDYALDLAKNAGW
jgi:endoglucanase